MITKKEIVEAGRTLAEIFESGGTDALVEQYHGYSDRLSDEIVEEIKLQTDIGVAIELEMNITLAKKAARYAGLTVLPKARPGYRYRLQKLPK